MTDGPSTRADLLTIESEALPTGTEIVSLRGKEGLSQPYHFEAGLLIRDASFDSDGAIRERVTLTIHPGDGQPPQKLHGIISAIEHLNQWQSQALYRIRVVPLMWNLTNTHHSRIFTDKSVVEILEAIFELNELTTDDYSLQLQGDFPAREHVCQYRESDFDFICRWMEREGIYFYFEHGDEAEKIIITDTTGAQDSLRSAAVRYVPMSDDSMAREAFSHFSMRHVAMPARVASADYNYNTPDVDVSADTEVVDTGAGVLRRWGENADEPGRAWVLAGNRADHLKAHRKLFSGRGRAFNLRPGYTFEVEEHPHAAFNQRYLCIELEHYANQAGSNEEYRELLGLDFTDEYQARVLGMARTEPYRAPFRTPWPRIDSCECAIVDGPADSDFAQIDNQGRYHVRVKFDENEHTDGEASTWVRMLQPHAGSPEGFHFPLRKGTEVLLIFLGGDPDRPVIAGGVPDPQNPSPVTSANHTQNIIHTGENNLIRMEDQGQHIFISTPPESTHIHMGSPLNGFNFVISTDGDGRFYFGRDQEIHVVGDLQETVDGETVTEFYNTHHKTEVLQDRAITVMGTQFEHVVGMVEETFDQGQQTTIGSFGHGMHITDGQTIRVIGPQTFDISAERDDIVGQDVRERYGAKQSTAVTGEREEEVGGEVRERYRGGQKTWVTGGDRELDVPATNRRTGGRLVAGVGAYRTQTERAVEFEAGADVTIQAATGVTIVTSGGNVTIQNTGGNITIDGSGTVEVKSGSEIKLNC